MCPGTVLACVFIDIERDRGMREQFSAATRLDRKLLITAQFTLARARTTSQQQTALVITLNGLVFCGSACGNDAGAPAGKEASLGSHCYTPPLAQTYAQRNPASTHPPSLPADVVTTRSSGRQGFAMPTNMLMHFSKLLQYKHTQAQAHTRTHALTLIYETAIM